MAPAKISSGTSDWLPCWASRGIACPQPAVSAREDVKRLRVAPIVLASMEEAGKFKKEIETKATRAGVIWFVVRTKWFNAFWRSSVEMRLRWPSRTKKPKNTTHSKKAELPKDESKGPFSKAQSSST